MKIKKQHVSIHTGSFALIFCAAVALAYIAFLHERANLDFDDARAAVYGNTALPSRTGKMPAAKKLSLAVAQSSAPENLKTFSDSKIGIAFSYPESWSVNVTRFKEINNIGAIVLDPNTGQSKIIIYMSLNGFFATKNLNLPKATVGGKAGWNMDDVLAGAKVNGVFFTFDLGTNPRLKPQFKALLQSVKFE